MKPVDRFLALCDRLLAATSAPAVTVIGGGAGGVETIALDRGSVLPSAFVDKYRDRGQSRTI